MNELLTRDLTKDELSLISGGGETDSNYGLQEIYDYWEREHSRMESLDRNGDGDGWDEIGYVYGALATSGVVVTATLSASLNPLAGPAAIGTALFGAISFGAYGIDTYGMKSDLR